MAHTALLATKTRTLRLKDGRDIGIVEVGADEGPCVFFFHGWPGSRVGALSFHDAALAKGVRIIGVDRPGIGLSSPQPGRTLLDWPQDVAEIADQLGAERFSVLGISGGGPYALACAYLLDKRLDAVGVIAGMGPFSLGTEGMRDANKQLFAIASKANWLLRFFFWLGIGRAIKDTDKLKVIMQKMMADLPEVDRAILATPGLDERFVLELQEAFHQGAKWPAKEGALYTQPWGFALSDLPEIPTFVWHGELDVNVPIQMSRTLATQAPHTKASFFTDEGHISLLANHMNAILTAITPGHLHQGD